MRQRLRVALSVSTLVAFCFLGQRAAEAGVVVFDIDTFDTAQASGSPTANTVTAPFLDIWGIQRDIRVSQTSGTVTAQVTGGNLVFAAAAASAGDVEVVWDGTDNDATKVGRMATPHNLIGDGNAFIVTVASATNANAHLVLEVLTDGGHSWIRAFPIPSAATPRTYYLAYTGFVPNRGTGPFDGTVDFASVRAIRMFVRGGDVTVNVASVQTGIATATVLATKSESHGPAAPGDTLNYTATVKGFWGDAEDVVFTDTVDTNTTYVNGSLKTSPIAVNDGYPNAVEASVASPFTSAFGVIQNDRDPLSLPLHVVVSPDPQILKSARGNDVSMAADGSFTWTDTNSLGGIPDSFTYTLANNNGDATLQDTGLVVITQTDDAPSVISTTPTTGTTHVSPSVAPTVTFSEPVAVTIASFTFNCGGPITYTLTPGSPATTHTLTPTAPLPDGATCTITVNAGQLSDVDTIDPPDGLNADASFTFQIQATPVVTLSGTPTSYTENAVPVAVDANLTVTDADDTDLTGGTVAITGNFQSAEDTLAFVNQNGITGSYTAGTGVLVLSGTSSVANYQTALRSITYSNSSDAPNTTARGVSFTVTDGVLTSTTVVKPVAVVAVADPPVVTLSVAGITYTENDVATVLDAGLTVTDVDSTNMSGATVTISANYQNGADVLSAIGSGTITAAFSAGTGVLTLSGPDTIANYVTVLRSVKYANSSDDPTTAQRTLSWVVTDSSSTPSVAKTSTVDVLAVNDPPVLANSGSGLAYTENGAAAAINTAITVADPDSTNLVSGTVSITANFQANKDVLSFTNQNGITGSYSGTTGVLTLTGSSSVANYQTALRTVTYSSTSEDPSTAARTVSFQVDDGGTPLHASNIITSTITVTNVNDAPTANGFTNLPAQAGIPITYPAGKLGGTDNAEEAANGSTVAVATAADSVTNGTVTINTNGSFVFTPNSNGLAAGFTYHVVDDGRPGSGVSSAVVGVTFSVAGPPLYFVKSAAVGSGNCTLGNECLLATAITKMNTDGAGSTAITNAKAFISDANSHSPGAIALGASGQSIIGQGVTVAFDAFFVIGVPGQGTLAARPATSQTRPTVTGANATITVNTNSVLRGFNLTETLASNGVVASGRSGVVVQETAITAVNGDAVNLNNTSAAFTDFTITVGSGNSGRGFIAAGGGAVTASGTANTIATDTGTALSVTSTAILAPGLTFRSISAGNASSGPANGIVLNTPGSNAGLIVTGNGGVCTLATPTCTGGLIRNTTGDGIALTSTQTPAFSLMRVLNTGGQGISATTLPTGLTLTSVIVSGAGNSDNEDGLTMVNVAGTVSIQGSTFIDAEEELISIDNNNTNMTLNVGTTTACTFTHTNTLAALGSFTANGILFTGRGSSNYTLNVKDSAFNDIKGFAIQVGGDGTWSGNNTNVTLDNNDFLVSITNSLGNLNNRADAVNIQSRGTVDIDADIKNNVLDGGGGGGIQLGADESSNIAAKITGNTITDQFADGILIGVDENATMTVQIDNNIITNTSSDGMELSNGIDPGGLSTLNAIITNNNVSNHNNNLGANSFFGGIAVFGAADGADVTFVNIDGNSVSGNPNPGTYVDYVIDTFGDTVIVQGAGTGAVAEADFLAPPAPANTSSSPGGGKTFLNNAFYSNGATVPLPSITP